MTDEKGVGRGRGAWTAKGAQADQEARIVELEAEVEALSAAVFGGGPTDVPADEPA